MLNEITKPRQMILRGLLFFHCCLITVVYSYGWQQQHQLESDSIEVFTTLTLVDVLQINDNQQTMSVDFVVRLRWVDPAWQGGSQSLTNLELENIWHPELQIINARNISPKIDATAINAYPDGSIVFRQRYYGELSVNAHSTKFPFDNHIFEIKLVAINTQPVKFISDPEVSVKETTFSVANWRIQEGDLEIKPFTRTLIHKPAFSKVIYSSRDTSFYFWKIFVPLTFVVMMSWTIFWVDPKHPSQLTVAATAMLSLIAFQFTMTNLLPNLSYLTRLDIYVLECTFLVLLALVEAVLTNNLVSRRKENLAQKVDRYSRWVFPSVYTLACIIALTWR